MPNFHVQLVADFYELGSLACNMTSLLRCQFFHKADTLFKWIVPTRQQSLPSIYFHEANHVDHGEDMIL